LSVFDSDSADTWIDENYDEEILILLRDKHIGGPIASMLSIDSAALTIFGTLSANLLQTAQALADLSSFPVVIRPLEEDPSPRFR
jgi:hypothetical protein